MLSMEKAVRFEFNTKSCKTQLKSASDERERQGWAVISHCYGGSNRPHLSQYNIAHVRILTNLHETLKCLKLIFMRSLDTSENDQKCTNIH